MQAPCGPSGALGPSPRGDVKVFQFSIRKCIAVVKVEQVVLGRLLFQFSI
ncbi:MAG: hypothetical protein ACO2PN_15165 [Pyrobaculum sp.]